MKPGLKTTEFFTTQVSAGGLATIVMTDRDWRVRIAALAAIALIQSAYAFSRAYAKSFTEDEEETE